jgi:predicted phage terminase large subunit-like protein
LRQDTEIAWEVMNLQAIDDTTGQPLWGDRWPLDALEQRQKMVGEYDWASLYQGRPMPRDGYVFKEPVRWREEDLNGLAGCRIAIGVDPAATSKTSADHSVIMVMSAKGSGLEQVADVVDLWRGQVETPALVKQIAKMQELWGAAAFVEAVGGFKAVPQMLRSMHPGLRVVDITPTADKFTRSLAVKAAWNAGRVRVPMPGTTFRSGGRVDDLVKEVCKFTGKGDRHDDQVDALAHAFSAIDQRLPSARRGVQVLKGGLA